MTLGACADLVRRGDPDRFAAVMAAPPAARAVLLPLYAFNLEVARAPWVTQEPMIAEMRLQWWRDALAEIADGGVVRGHEVVGPLALILRERGVPIAPLDALIEARRWDIYRDPFADAAAFAAHIDATAGGLTWVAAQALGAPAAAEPVVRDHAYAAGLLAWFRAVPALEARGRVPLVDGRPAAVAALARDGLARLGRARARRALVPAAARAALLAGWQAGPGLRLVVRDPGRVARGQVQLSEFARRGGLLWQAVSGRW